MDLAFMKSIGQKTRILYVEDDVEIRSLLSNYFKKIFIHVDIAADGQEGLKKFKEHAYDLVITDIQMPYMNGLEMIAEMKSLRDDIEVVVTTAFNDTRYMTDAIRLGVNNYILKPIDYNQMNMALYKSLSHLKQRYENAAYKQKLEGLVEQRTHKMVEMKEHSISGIEKLLETIVEKIDSRTDYLPGHSRRVAVYAGLIAAELGYTEAEIRTLERAAMLHDIGKVAVPDTLLAAAPETLSDDERDVLQRHVAISIEILHQTSYLNEIVEIVQCHHEYYDGSGYPEGRRGDEIPLLAHILIVANAFDGMTGVASAQKRMDMSAAMDQLKASSGSRFHPKVVTAAIKVLASEAK